MLVFTPVWKLSQVFILHKYVKYSCRTPEEMERKKGRDHHVLSSSLWCIFPFREKYMDLDIALQIPFQVPRLTALLSYCHISMHGALKEKSCWLCLSQRSGATVKVRDVFASAFRNRDLLKYECATTDLYLWWK